MEIRLLMSIVVFVLLTLVAVLVGLALFTALMARRARLKVPPLGEFLEIEGTVFHFVDVGPDIPEPGGNEPTIVMIHGLGGTMRTFTYAVLGELRQRYRLITIDRPGSGYSTRPDDRASIAHQAALFAKFIAAKGLQQPLVVGHSYGGTVALTLALDHPESVGALALLAPLTHPQSTVPAPFRGLQIESRLMRWLIGWTLAVPVGLMQRDVGLVDVFGPDPVVPDFETRGGGMLGLRPRSFYCMSTDLMSMGTELTDLVNRYGGLCVPVGVLFGTGDRILDVQAHGASMSGKVPDLYLEYIENGGHMMPLIAPHRTADFIRRMAQATPRAAPRTNSQATLPRPVSRRSKSTARRQ
jgi:pimeloyl-ACP methyl ester carboxylesterase